MAIVVCTGCLTGAGGLTGVEAGDFLVDHRCAEVCPIHGTPWAATEHGQWPTRDCDGCRRAVANRQRRRRHAMAVPS